VQIDVRLIGKIGLYWKNQYCSIVLKFVIKIKELLKLQRSNLAPVLLNIFISNLKKGIESLSTTFSNST